MDAILLRNIEAEEVSGTAHRADMKDTYSGKVLEFKIPFSGEYLVRVACNSGEALASFELIINGKKAEPESYPFIQMTQGITRQP